MKWKYNIHSLHISIGRNLFEEQILLRAISYELQSPEGFSSREGGDCCVILTTSLNGITRDLLIEGRCVGASSTIVSVEEVELLKLAKAFKIRTSTHSSSLTSEITRPQRCEGNDTSLSIELNSLFLRQAKCVKYADRPRDRAKSTGKSKNRPLLINGTEVGILGIWQFSAVFKSSSDIGICTRLERKILLVLCCPIPITPIGLLVCLGEK